MLIKKLKKIIFLMLGFIFVSLGIIGIFIPGLPTTPFLLAAAFCFLRSSRLLFKKLIRHKIFGKYIYNYLKYKSVTLRSKIAAIFFLWITLTLSILIIRKIYLSVILILIGCSVTVHLLLLKTLILKNKKENDINSDIKK